MVFNKVQFMQFTDDDLNTLHKALALCRIIGYRSTDADITDTAERVIDSIHTLIDYMV